MQPSADASSADVPVELRSAVVPPPRPAPEAETDLPEGAPDGPGATTDLPEKAPDLPGATGDAVQAATDAAETAQGAELTERERLILAFEQRWWRHAGAKEQTIRDTFGLSSTRYYQLLNALIDNPAALAAEPVLVGRLRRLRASRARNRRR